MSKINLKFASTGALKSMTREELKSFLSKNGHHLTEEMNERVDFLICNESFSDSFKFNYAVKNNIGIIDEDDLLEMIKKDNND